jgi:hypothetical protein
MASSTPTLGNILTADDRLDIADALARFAAGIDENDPATRAYSSRPTTPRGAIWARRPRPLIRGTRPSD